MIQIWLGSARPDNLITNIDAFFDSGYEDQWLLDPMAKEMILDVDKSKVKGPHLIESPVLGPIAPSELSGGVKALICMLFDDEFIQDATNCGDNCAKWIQRIGSKKDLTIHLGYIIDFCDDEYFDMIVMNTNRHVTNQHDFVDACLEAGL